MKTDSEDNGIVDVLGHTFRRVKSGLDEEQVISIIKELISERDTLIKRQEHLSSLTRLYENVVAEADELAKQIMKEAVEQAQAESKAILAKAEEQTKQMLEEKRAEAMAIAQKEAEAIKADAQKQSEALLKEKVEKLQSQLKDMARLLYGEMLTQAESLERQAVKLEAEFEQKLSELAQGGDQANMKEENNTASGISSEVITEAVTQVHAVDQSDTGRIEERAPVSKIDSNATDYKEWVQLEFLPPRDKDEIAMIKTHLDGLPEVKTTELMTLSDKTLVEVWLSKPMNLTETLCALPQVKQAEEVTEGEKRKIQITLYVKSQLEVTKNALSTEVHRIFSGGKTITNVARAKGIDSRNVSH